MTAIFVFRKLDPGDAGASALKMGAAVLLHPLLCIEVLLQELLLSYNPSACSSIILRKHTRETEQVTL